MQSTKVQGYRWDTGPSLLLLPQKYEDRRQPVAASGGSVSENSPFLDAFKRLGSDIKKELNLKRVDPPYRVTFGDETFVDVDYDPMKMTEQMEKFEPGCTSNYYRFLSVARRMLDMGLERFVDRQFESWPELVDPIGTARRCRDRQRDRKTRDERLRALFSFQTLYAARNTVAVAVAVGPWVDPSSPGGSAGWKNVKESLAGLANKHGVKIQTDTPVDEVLVSEGRAVGLKLRDGRVENGDVVVVNADTPYAYQKLLEHTPSQAEAPSVAETSEDLDGREYSCGVIAFFWAVDCKVDYLRPSAWEPITEAAQMPERPNFYVHCPTRTDPSAAPEGCESIMVLFPVANMQQMAEAGFTPGKKGELYRGLREQARKTVLKRFKEAGCGDLEKHIVEETVRDPELIGELYNLQHGATFGLSHGLLPWQGGLAMTRPPPRAAEVRGPGLDRSRVLPGALKLGRFDAVRGVGEVDLV
ncbi:zeta-carotene-forming phytoene desaturase (2-step phytoene desaturase) [Durusdinium trenchii]|uniref:Zeta-carotene-forming phytoene desaturase (2-step phytoene desaturase) n=1 Tax=Durusdinium trenchii TaxID=1381693 RepID=A0ABP0QNE8_9DINO